jgi:hypothetical protein
MTPTPLPLGPREKKVLGHFYPSASCPRALAATGAGFDRHDPSLSGKWSTKRGAEPSGMRRGLSASSPGVLTMPAVKGPVTDVIHLRCNQVSKLKHYQNEVNARVYYRP